MGQISVRRPLPKDKDAWRSLFEGYRAFYKMPDDPQIVETVWQWVNDPNHATECLLARTEDDQIIGLAHFRDLLSSPQVLGHS
jgi:hypothetical protein